MWRLMLRAIVRMSEINRERISGLLFSAVGGLMLIAVCLSRIPLANEGYERTTRASVGCGRGLKIQSVTSTLESFNRTQDNTHFSVTNNGS